jgi:hypothetical protein
MVYITLLSAAGAWNYMSIHTKNAQQSVIKKQDREKEAKERRKAKN